MTCGRAVTLAGLLLVSLVAPGASGAVATGDAGSHATGTTTAGTVRAGPSAASLAVADASACDVLANGTTTADPDGDPLGWEAGCWANTTLALDQSDGLNRTETDALVARTMARIEVVRELEFQRDVPVETISIDEREARVERRYANVSRAKRLRLNLKWEALFVVNESTDAVEVQESTVTVASGYYSPREKRIVLVTANGSAPKVDELTLAHELVHPLQNQQFDVAERFDLSTFERHRTTDGQHAVNGLVEGDAELVRHLYRDRCGDEWQCTRPSVDLQTDDDGGNIGMSLPGFQPYTDGPGFLTAIRNQRGWDGVNAVYRNPPERTTQVIHPETYPAGNPTRVAYTDASSDEWRLLEPHNDKPVYETFGQPVITVMMLYPNFETEDRAAPVLPQRAFLNETDDGLSRVDPYHYGDNLIADGWDAGRFYPYVTNESADTGEMAYVWKTVWETRNDSREFVTEYERLLEFHNATPVEGRENTYRIPAGDEFADAFYVNRTGDTVYVVNAPSVDALSSVRAGAAPESGGKRPGRSLPGAVGVVVAVAAVVGALAVARRRG